MALVMETSALSGLSDSRKEKTQEKENLWTKILGEIQSSDISKLSTCQSVVVLGDNESGKTTLIAKLQGNEDPLKGSGLEYAYIEVRDEYRDEKTRLGVWILDGDKEHAELLEFAINEKNFENTLVLLTVSMNTPWSIMDQLHSCVSSLQDHIDKLNIEPGRLKEFQNKLEKSWQDYAEPGDELEGTTAMKRSTRGNLENEDEPALPLPDNVLTRNLGLKVIVVVTKTDYMSVLEKEFDFKEEHFDFIQQSIRKFCLQYGAALFYTSVKEDKNCDLLYKYLVHQIYGLPFRTPALVVEKDAVFVPFGWDNERKISILYESMHTMTPEDYYPDVIVKPQVARKTIMREIEVVAEDENTFLSRMLSHMQANPPGSVTSGNPNRTDSPLRQSPAVQKTGERRVSSGSAPLTPHTQMNSSKKIDPTKGVANSNEGLLANFFNALLNKKVATPPSGSSRPIDKVLSRTEAAAELDHLSSSPKSKSLSSNSSLPPMMLGGEENGATDDQEEAVINNHVLDISENGGANSTSQPNSTTEANASEC